MKGQYGQRNLDAAGFGVQRPGHDGRRRRGIALPAADDLEEFFGRCDVAKSSHARTPEAI